jgi:ribosomal protein S18 acetylase RimI-like enzyme
MSIPPSNAGGGDPEVRPSFVEIADEREPIAGEALQLIRRAFPPRERQPLEQIAMEIAEKRLGLLTSYDFHLIAALSAAGEVLAVVSGVYLGGVNTGFVTYLAVDPPARDQQVGRGLRVALVDAFRRDARALDWPDLAAVVGEVRLESPWLARLVRDRAVLPLDLNYFHPGEEPTAPDARWVLYRQPVADDRLELPVGEVRQLLYAIWRRAYRVRWPLEREGFKVMLRELSGRSHVGSHPEVPVHAAEDLDGADDADLDEGL